MPPVEPPASASHADGANPDATPKGEVAASRDADQAAIVSAAKSEPAPNQADRSKGSDDATTALVAASDETASPADGDGDGSGDGGATTTAVAGLTADETPSSDNDAADPAQRTSDETPSSDNDAADPAQRTSDETPSSDDATATDPERQAVDETPSSDNDATTALAGQTSDETPSGESDCDDTATAPADDASGQEDGGDIATYAADEASTEASSSGDDGDDIATIAGDEGSGDGDAPESAPADAAAGDGTASATRDAEGEDSSTAVVLGAPGTATQARTTAEHVALHLRTSSGPKDGVAWRRRHFVLVAGAPLLVVVVVLLAWALDSTVLSGQVARNVEVAGRSVGGLGEAELPGVVAELAADVASREVRIVNGDRTYETTVGEMGVTVDEEATAEAALHADRDTALAIRPFAWLGSFFGPRTVPVRYTFSEATAALTLARLQSADPAAAAEPTVVYDHDTHQLTAIPGRAGRGVDVEHVAAELRRALDEMPTGPIVLTMETTEVTPRFTDEQASELAAEANAMTAEGITLTVEGTAVRVEAPTLREWIGLAPPSAGFELAIDGDQVAEDLPELFPTLPGAPENATVTLSADGRPRVVPARNGNACCGDDSAERIWRTLQAGETEVNLEAKLAEPEVSTAEVEEWGIARPVGGDRAWRDGAEAPGPTPGFTTYYTPGETRVTNIHRIADMVRGAVIPPGGSFSLNDHVGQRTVETGFVEAGAINQGRHVQDVGGGVSQFATTLFNAAYFAGLDITEYQAHSEYFDRYPRGREATMGYPNPDLVIENDTPYGVLIWTSYTDSSVTVTLYSTPHATAEQTGITESPAGLCTVVETTRTRTYPDGRNDTDTFTATYRPGEGLDCNGNEIPPPPDG